MPQVVIGERFCGPDGSSNGGYACGLVAAFVDGPAEVTLRSRPPLGRPLEVRRDDDGVSLWDGETLIASGRGAAGGFGVQAPVDLEQARRASERYEWLHEHPSPRCFVCGPQRAAGDGLRIFAGPVAGRDVHAAPWTPPRELADERGIVRAEFVWAALDCPSGVVTNRFEGAGEPLLGRLTADLRAPVRAGEEHVIVSWPRQRDGRKLLTASALFTADGEPLAAAQAVWIDVGSR